MSASFLSTVPDNTYLRAVTNGHRGEVGSVGGLRLMLVLLLYSGISRYLGLLVVSYTALGRRYRHRDAGSCVIR